MNCKENINRLKNGHIEKNMSIFNNEYLFFIKKKKKKIINKKKNLY